MQCSFPRSRFALHRGARSRNSVSESGCLGFNVFISFRMSESDESSDEDLVCVTPGGTRAADSTCVNDALFTFKENLQQLLENCAPTLT